VPAAKTSPLEHEVRFSDTVHRKNRFLDKPTSPPYPEDVQRRLRAPSPRYSPEFAHLVIETSCEGYSFGGFAGKVGIGRSTVNAWREKHPEFDEACARADAARQHYWESILLHVAETGGTGSQGTVAMFGVLNVGRHDWSNRQQVEHTGTLTLSSLIESSMKAIEARRLTSPTAIVDPLLIEGEAVQPDLDDLF
jgi:hypothetical protein